MRKYCPSCNATASTWRDNFCAACGKGLTTAPEPHYVGISQDAGVYRVIATIQKHFDSREDAEETARHSQFGEGEGRFEETKVEFISTTITNQSHPYICGSCPPNKSYVSDTNNGSCNRCGACNWKLRI